MSGIVIEVTIILVLVALNGFLAMAEISVVAARKARLQQLVEQGAEKAFGALQLANDPGDFLSTVQIGITLVGILAGAFGGATIAEQLALWLDDLPILGLYSELIALVLVVAAITYLTLIFGELVPKRLGLNNPERVAMQVSKPMRSIARLARPVVMLLSASSEGVIRLLGVKPSQEPPVTEEEIKVLIEQGTQAGIFESAEQDMVAAVFRLADRRVGSLMTPRTEIVWLDMEDPWDVNRNKLGSRIHSRFPVAHHSLDNVIGVVQVKDLLAGKVDIQQADVENTICAPLYVPESMPALKVVELFKKTRVHTALVIDEYGGLQGMITVFDLLESLVGEIPDTIGDETPEVVRRADGSWLLDGMLPIDEFEDLFRKYDFPEEERVYYQTLGGLVMTKLGRIPKAADTFIWNNLCFEVVDMDGHRVDKVIVNLADAGSCGDDVEIIYP